MKRVENSQTNKNISINEGVVTVDQQLFSFDSHSFFDKLSVSG